MKEARIERERELRVNYRIKVREVRLISSTGEQLGLVRIEDALARAQDEGLDLIEIVPTAKPPVCKILDYGKFKYQENRKKHEAKKKQVIVHLKEIRFRPVTDKHDIDFKVKNISRFLQDGDKVKIAIQFRGREMAYKKKGEELLKRVIAEVGEIGVMESYIAMEGRQMYVILVPPHLAPKVTKKPAPAATAPAVAKPKVAPVVTTAPASPEVIVADAAAIKKVVE